MQEPRTEHASISIRVPTGEITGDLIIPDNARGLVIFSHGSGSSRFSPRNRYVAEALQKMGIATLLFDLLTPEEDRDYANRFNIGLLTERLVEVTVHAGKKESIGQLPAGYFGASTGAASAIAAAVSLKSRIKAVVSRGGRPDMALSVIPQLEAPTLLLVGSRDTDVLELNQKAYNAMHCTKELQIIEGATHLFEEEGKLEEVTQAASKWFDKYLK